MGVLPPGRIRKVRSGVDVAHQVALPRLQRMPPFAELTTLAVPENRFQHTLDPHRIIGPLAGKTA